MNDNFNIFVRFPSVRSSILKLQLLHFAIIVRSGRSSIRDSWANNVIWHQGLIPVKLLIIVIFVGYLMIMPQLFFPLPGNLLSPDSLSEAFDGVTAVVCSPLPLCLYLMIKIQIDYNIIVYTLIYR